MEPNRRFAPDGYLEVAEVSGVRGEPADHLVVMRRMPERRRLSTVLASGADVRGVNDRLARTMVAVHSNTERGPEISAEGTRDALGHTGAAASRRGVRSGCPAAARRGCREGRYPAEHTGRTYREVLHRAGRLLARGETVVRDASWVRATNRADADPWPAAVTIDTAGSPDESLASALRAVDG